MRPQTALVTALITTVFTPMAHASQCVAGALAAPDAVASNQTTERWKNAFAKGKLDTPSGEVLPYRVAAPTSTSPHPLVLVLHGSGAMGSDNERQLGPFAASWAQVLGDPDPPIVIVPQVSARSSDYVLCNGLPCASRPGPSFGQILQLFDTFSARKDVDASRVYVVGFSMGASAALQLALARPKVIAGMVLFAPVPPPDARASELAQIPLLVIHGDRDNENPFGVMRSWVRVLNATGGKARLSVRKGMGHQVPGDMLTSPVWRRQLLRANKLGEVCQ